MLGHHVTIRLWDDLPLARSPDEELRFIRSFVAAAEGFPVLAFHLVDTHFHFICLCGAREARRIAWLTELRVRHGFLKTSSFEPARARPVNGLRHLENALFYVLQQRERHRLPTPHLHACSSLPDLLGLRLLLPGSRTLLRRTLPRLDEAPLWDILGHPRPGDWEDPTPIREAAAFAAGLRSLEGRSLTAVRARAAAARLLVPRVGLTRSAELLDRSERQLRSLLRREPDPPMERAIAACLALWPGARQEAEARRPPVDRPKGGGTGSETRHAGRPPSNLPPRAVGRSLRAPGSARRTAAEWPNNGTRPPEGSPREDAHPGDGCLHSGQQL